MKTVNPSATNEQPLYSNEIQDGGTTGHRLSVCACKKILNTDNLHYTDEEVIYIRDWLYRLAGCAAEQRLRAGES